MVGKKLTKQKTTKKYDSLRKQIAQDLGPYEREVGAALWTVEGIEGRDREPIQDRVDPLEDRVSESPGTEGGMGGPDENSANG